MVTSVYGSGATDLSVIARRFEEKCEESSLRTLSSIIDVFGAVVNDTPPEHVNSLLVQISRGGSSDNAANTQSCIQLLEPPLRSIELWKNVSTNRIVVSMAVQTRETLNLRFDNATWDDRPVEVRQIVFQMASVDVPPTMRAAAGGLQQEVKHLTASALSILGKVCDGVRFDDVTKVPNMLAEALLRVVRPLTPSLKLEKITLSVIIGDDPVAITATVASEQQLALKSASRPERHSISCVRLELPLHTTLATEYATTLSTNK